MRIIIIGAGGGIGSALLQECMDKMPDATFCATYLNNKPAIEAANLIWHPLDVTDEVAVEDFSHQYEQVDWIINCVGFLHSIHHGPEKSINQADGDFFMDNMRRNALPTLLIAKYFNRKLHPAADNYQGVAKLVTLSARIGSISDNRLGGWYSYRASKSALNMILKTLNQEWQRIEAPIATLALHPGTTDTPLSRPFQRNLPEGQLMPPTQTAGLLYQQILGLTLASSGSFIDFNGEPIPY